VALDRDGNLAAGTSTGGMTNKRFGRVGDVPVIGAGTYANNKTVAVSGTGWGEKFIKNTVAHDISALVEYKGLSVQEAADTVIHRKLDPGDGGVIAVGRDGSLALVYNSNGMFRGAADSTGRFEVAIWEPGVGR
jgi:beta-aspartyl-peptidase (threonine type)